ncbi:ABC transporter ATP-binding protein [Microaerobacter geothermalis]|uniref:ABC transporter ATP-binding protein n=1 Tax=Microaerobacter geothermalis TaxID=674972 RepID=UPI0038B330A6
MIQQVSHSFMMGKIEVPVLHQISLSIKRGELVSLCGTSGSGKSTLLNLMAGLMKPTSGEVIVNGEIISRMTENQLCLFRRKYMGFIFQSYHLLPNLTALENVELPLVFSGESPKTRRKKATEILERVGLGDRMKHKPNELSGGQQQRVSIARALINQPAIVLADEPTGNLDSGTEAEILSMLKQMNQELGSTFVIVTHDEAVAAQSHRTIYLRDGKIARSLREPIVKPDHNPSPLRDSPEPQRESTVDEKLTVSAETREVDR